MFGRFILRLLILGFALILGFTKPSLATSNCYNLQNDLGANVQVSFQYPHGVVPNEGVLNLSLIPNGNYSYCIDEVVGAGNYTYADIQSGKWDHLDGRLAMGFGPLASPPGTYRIVPVAAQPAKPKFGNSSYPGNEKFMVTHVDSFTYALGGVGNAQFIHISITCKNGQKWNNLVCLPNGSKCNVSIDEYIHGLTQWNVGQHCDGAHGNG